MIHILQKQFQAGILDILEKQSGLTNIQSIVEWTDGCSAQYKCKFSVFDIAESNLKRNRNYFETSHGKSLCDGLGSIVKNTCLRAVTSGSAIIGNAEAIFKFCETKLAHGPQRKPDGNVEISMWTKKMWTMTGWEYFH